MKRSISIRTLLLSIIMTLSLALIGSLGFSAWALFTMAEDERVLTDQVIPTITLSGEMSADVLRRHLLLNQHVNSTDLATMNRIETDINAETDKIDALRVKLAATLVQDQTRAALTRYAMLKAEYFVGVQRVLPQSRAGEKAAAAETLRSMRAVVGSMDQTLNEMITLVDRRSKMISELALQHFQNNINVLAAIALIALLLSAIASWFVVARVIKPVVALTTATNAIASGNLDAAVPVIPGGNEMATLANAIGVLRQEAIEKRRLESAAAEQDAAVEETRRAVEADRNLATRTQREQGQELEAVVMILAQGLRELTQGNLTHRIDVALPDAYTAVRDDFNETVERLSATMRTIQATSADIGLASREINTGADDLSKRTEEQASSLEETAARTEELAASVKASAQGAKAAAAIATEALGAAETGGAIAGQAVDAMARIETASQKISDIIRVIDDIAFQTNLLALNAAVEAARAGDAGKGFAVVASEVRTLAQRSGEAAKDISGLISSSNAEVGAGVALVRKAGEQLAQIEGASRKVAATIAEISTASAEQANGIDEMSQAVAHLDEMTQANAALAEESAASAGALSGRIGDLNNLVAAFRTGHEDTGAAPRQPAPMRTPASVQAPAKTAVAAYAPPALRASDTHAMASGSGAEPERLRKLAEAAFAQTKAQAPVRQAAPARKTASGGRANDAGWEEF